MTLRRLSATSHVRRGLVVVIMPEAICTVAEGTTTAVEVRQTVEAEGEVDRTNSEASSRRASGTAIVLPDYPQSASK